MSTFCYWYGCGFTALLLGALNVRPELELIIGGIILTTLAIIAFFYYLDNNRRNH